MTAILQRRGGLKETTTGVCDNCEVIQYRRLAGLLLGVWLGAGIFADIAVTQNFQTVDRFLAQPGSVATARELDSIGRERERAILRRNAGEENNAIFENWEWAELAIGGGLLFLLLSRSAPSTWIRGGAILMLAIVAVQHFLLSPQIADMGRKMADGPSDTALAGRFWTYHGIYSGSEILKLLAGGALAVGLQRG